MLLGSRVRTDVTARPASLLPAVPALDRRSASLQGIGTQSIISKQPKLLRQRSGFSMPFSDTPVALQFDAMYHLCSSQVSLGSCCATPIKVPSMHRQVSVNCSHTYSHSGIQQGITSSMSVQSIPSALRKLFGAVTVVGMSGKNGS